MRNKFQLYWQRPHRKAIAQHLIIEDIDQESDLFAVVWPKDLIEPLFSVQESYLIICSRSGCMMAFSQEAWTSIGLDGNT